MPYPYPAESLPIQWNSASTVPASYFEQYDSTWATSLDGMEDPYADLDYWREVSWDHQFDTDLQSPLSFTSDDQSPTTSSNGMSNFSINYAASSPSQSSVPRLATENSSSSSSSGSEGGSTRGSVDDTKVKRRRIQNRNSQRAYRERTKQKEEQMAAVIEKLEGEIEALRKREKSSIEMIETLTREVERLKKKGLVLHYRPT